MTLFVGFAESVRVWSVRASVCVCVYLYGFMRECVSFDISYEFNCNIDFS